MGAITDSWSIRAPRTEAEQVELVLGDLVALFLRHRPGRLASARSNFGEGWTSSTFPHVAQTKWWW